MDNFLFHQLCFYNPFKEVPGMVMYFMDSLHDWGYNLKVKNNIAGAMKGRTIKYPRGFNLGGSG